MKRAPQPTPGPGPRRPFPPVSYQAAGRLATLARIAAPPLAHIIELDLTPRLPGDRWPDTWSNGTVQFASGYRCSVCTTFDRRGFLLLELPRDAPLNAEDAASAAQAVVSGHIQAQARQSRRGHGRN